MMVYLLSGSNFGLLDTTNFLLSILAFLALFPYHLRFLVQAHLHTIAKKYLKEHITTAAGTKLLHEITSIWKQKL